MIKNLTLAILSSFVLLACTDDQSTVESQQPAVEATKAVAETTTSVPTDASPDFDTHMLQLSQDYFALRPETATYFGVPDEKAGAGASSRLGNYSVAGEAERRAGLKAMLDKLESIDETNLTESQKVSLQLVKTEATNAYAPATLVEYGLDACLRS